MVDAAVRPSGNETFNQIAELLATGRADADRPTLPPNTHLRHWPDGGSPGR